MKTIADLFKLLESMQFFAGDVPLNKAEAYLAIKEYFGDQMSEPIPENHLKKINVTKTKNTTQGEQHFQKRDLNEAEEY